MSWKHSINSIISNLVSNLTGREREMGERRERERVEKKERQGERRGRSMDLRVWICELITE
jgi:hypothetical protein